jgi:hypothetical protein
MPLMPGFLIDFVEERLRPGVATVSRLEPRSRRMRARWYSATRASTLSRALAIALGDETRLNPQGGDGMGQE